MSERITLGIETSGRAGSVAIWSRDEGATEKVFEEGLIHGVALAPSVREILRGAGAGFRDLALVAVGTGPGSYTGVRVGVAFAKTLALAAGIPVTGVPSFDALAENAPEGSTVVVARDARRDSLYLRTYEKEADGARPLGDLLLVARERVRDHLPPDAVVFGDAAEGFPGLLSGNGRSLGKRALWRSAAAHVARLGAARVDADGADDLHDLSPIYLRVSQAEERMAARDGEAR